MGAERAPGRKLQKEKKQVKRVNASSIVIGKPDASLSMAGGLVSFHDWCAKQGVDKQLDEAFGHMKTGAGLVYPMGGIVSLLVDMSVMGAPRVYGIEALASDPLIVHLHGGAIPSVDTFYRDLKRFDAADVQRLETITSEHGLAAAVQAGLKEGTLDIDPTVMELFGEQQYAFRGYNPHYPGRPSYCSPSRKCLW